jgi:hypothetical protein
MVDVQMGQLALLGGSTLYAGSVFTGAGETRLNTGTHTLNGTIFSTNLVLFGGALDGQGTLSGTVTWVFGQINETASVTVATDGALILSSGVKFEKPIYGILTNAGTITWQPLGNLVLGGTLHNLAGALFDAQVDNASITSAHTNARIINDGVFRKSTGRFNVFCAVPVINNGTMEILPGTLQLDGGCANLTGTISLLGGTFSMVQPLDLAGGRLTGWGTVATDVTNSGCIRPSLGNDALTIQGHFEQTLGGRMEFELAGEDPGTNQSRLHITDSALLGGSLGVAWDDDYLPSPGTLFPVLTFGSAKGEFCCLDHFILLGQGRRLEPVYGASGLTLATVAAPEPSTIPLKLTVDDSALICWPEEFSGYELYGSTNLSSSSWMLLPGITNRFLEAPPLPREKFYQLRKR